MATKEHAQQVSRLLDQLRKHLKNAPEHEVLGGIFAERLETLFRYRVVEGIEVATVECRDDAMAQRREEFADAEREASTCREKVVGKFVEGGWSALDNDDEIDGLSVIPTRAVLRLIRIAKGHGVVEPQQLETKLMDALKHTLFEQQTVGIGHQRQTRDLRREFTQDLCSPIRHGSLVAIEVSRPSKVSVLRAVPFLRDSFG